MAYTTEAKVKAVLTRLADDIIKSLEPDEFSLPLLLSKGDNIINGYIADRYEVPLPAPLPVQLLIIEEIATHLCVKFAWDALFPERQAGDEPSLSDKYWRWAIGLLEKIQSNQFNLYTGPGGAVPITDTPEGTGALGLHLNNLTEDDLQLSRTAQAANSVISEDY